MTEQSEKHYQQRFPPPTPYKPLYGIGIAAPATPVPGQTSTYFSKQEVGQICTGYSDVRKRTNRVSDVVREHDNAKAGGVLFYFGTDNDHLGAVFCTTPETPHGVEVAKDMIHKRRTGLSLYTHNIWDPNTDRMAEHGIYHLGVVKNPDNSEYTWIDAVGNDFNGLMQRFQNTWIKGGHVTQMAPDDREFIDSYWGKKQWMDYTPMEELKSDFFTRYCGRSNPEHFVYKPRPARLTFEARRASDEVPVWVSVEVESEVALPSSSSPSEAATARASMSNNTNATPGGSTPPPNGNNTTAQGGDGMDVDPPANKTAQPPAPPANNATGTQSPPPPKPNGAPDDLGGRAPSDLNPNGGKRDASQITPPPSADAAAEKALDEAIMRQGFTKEGAQDYATAQKRIKSEELFANASMEDIANDALKYRQAQAAEQAKIAAAKKERLDKATNEIKATTARLLNRDDLGRFVPAGKEDWLKQIAANPDKVETPDSLELFNLAATASADAKNQHVTQKEQEARLQADRAKQLALGRYGNFKEPSPTPAANAASSNNGQRQADSQSTPPAPGGSAAAQPPAQQDGGGASKGSCAPRMDANTSSALKSFNSVAHADNYDSLSEDTRRRLDQLEMLADVFAPPGVKVSAMGIVAMRGIIDNSLEAGSRVYPRQHLSGVDPHGKDYIKQPVHFSKHNSMRMKRLEAGGGMFMDMGLRDGDW